jgi:hypothetical protein
MRNLLYGKKKKKKKKKKKTQHIPIFYPYVIRPTHLDHLEALDPEGRPVRRGLVDGAQVPEVQHVEDRFLAHGQARVLQKELAGLVLQIIMMMMMTTVSLRYKAPLVGKMLGV